MLIWFEYFNIVDNDYFQCPSDNLTYSYRHYSSLQYYRHPFIYCGYRNFPSPYLTMRSTEQFRVHFRSNDDSDAALGFDGRYLFVNRSNSLIRSSTSCRSPFDPIIFINETNEHYGSLSSDGYPENLICEWSLMTNKPFQFNIEINILEIEGSKIKDPIQGCQNAVLRIYSERRMDELCGQQEKIYYFQTESNWFTIQFLSLTRQTKEPFRGFQLFWTIVRPGQCSNDDEYFDCQRNSTENQSDGFCIHRSLICDGQNQCQPLSNDDESTSNCFRMISTRSQNSSSTSKDFFSQNRILIVTLVFLCLTMFLIATSLIILLVRMKSQRREQTNEENDENSRRYRREKSADQVPLKKKFNQNSLDEDEVDLSGITNSLIHQAVTTV